LEANVSPWRINIAEQIRPVAIDSHNLSGVLRHLNVSAQIQLRMRLELELDIGVGERREKIEAEDVSEQ
jgi:hypothetical protein